MINMHPIMTSSDDDVILLRSQSNSYTSSTLFEFLFSAFLWVAFGLCKKQRKTKKNKEKERERKYQTKKFLYCFALWLGTSILEGYPLKQKINAHLWASLKKFTILVFVFPPARLFCCKKKKNILGAPSTP